MVNQAIAQVIPNMGGQEAAVAGSQAMVFTATDRELIEERGGKIDKNRSFLDVLKNRPLTSEVENEESTAKEPQDEKELKGRFREHHRMIKHANLYTPREKVEIKHELPDKYKEAPAPRPTPQPPASRPSPAPPAAPKTKAKAKQKKVEPKKAEPAPDKAYDQLATEQKALHSIGHRVKELHLKRLLSETESQFNTTSQEIEEATLSPIRPEGRAWVKEKLDRLTLATARYKLNLLRSLQAMDSNDQRKKYIKWLKKLITDASQK